MRNHSRAHRSTGAAHRPSLAAQGAHVMKPRGANAFQRMKIFRLVVSVFSPLSASRNRDPCTARFGLGGLTP
jgi:hypothetical protein